MRTGKYVAQGAHAATGALLGIGSMNADETKFEIPLTDPFIKQWVVGNFKKVAVYVTTDEELVDIYKKALAAGLPASLIKDAGLTEFGGVATLTAVGVGPNDEAKINEITGHLPLF